jgi:tetratricopeptide (TPR) repeat protein
MGDRRANQWHNDPVTDADTASAASSPVDTRPMRDPMTLRMAPRTMQEPLPPLVRMRGLPRGELLPANEEDTSAALALGEGVAGEIEQLLGEAQPHVALERLVTAGLPEATTRVMRARALLMDGRVDDARTALGNRDDDDVALGDAALALAEADLERAERRVQQAHAQQPRHIGPTYLQALVRVSRGDMQQGAELLTAVSRAVPTHAVARFQLGQILYAQGDPARAGTLYEMAWELQPSFVSPPLALCEMLVESRQYGEALYILERVSQVAPASLPPRQMQLRILVELGEREAALELGHRLHEQVPDDHDTTLLYVDALIDGDRVGDAEAVLVTLLESAGVDATQALRARRLQARIALMQRRVDEALEMLRAAAKSAAPAVCGEVCLELVHVGVAQHRREDVDLGLALLTRASDVSSLVSGALLARQHQLPSRARALAERARDLVPGTPAAAQLEGFIAAL